MNLLSSLHLIFGPDKVVAEAWFSRRKEGVAVGGEYKRFEQSYADNCNSQAIAQRTIVADVAAYAAKLTTE